MNERFPRFFMHGTIFVIIAAALLIVASGGPLAAGQASGPKIAAQELSFDFGNVAQGTEASHEFVFRNAGSAELVIQQVQPS